MIVDYGPDVRTERRNSPEPNGSYLWVCYQREPTGAVQDEHGNVTTPGTNPVNGSPTNELHVWVIKMNGTADEVRDYAQALAGQIEAGG